MDIQIHPRTADEQAFDQFCRYQFNGKSPDSEKIFDTRDAFVTNTGKQVDMKVTDIAGTEHTIMSGLIYGLPKEI